MLSKVWRISTCDGEYERLWVDTSNRSVQQEEDYYRRLYTSSVSDILDAAQHYDWDGRSEPDSSFLMMGLISTYSTLHAHLLPTIRDKWLCAEESRKAHAVSWFVCILRRRTLIVEMLLLSGSLYQLGGIFLWWLWDTCVQIKWIVKHVDYCGHIWSSCQAEPLCGLGLRTEFNRRRTQHTRSAFKTNASDGRTSDTARGT